MTIRKHPDTDELIEEIPVRDLQVGNEFFMLEDRRFLMCEDGAKCISHDDPTSQGLRKFDPNNIAMRIIPREK